MYIFLLNLSLIDISFTSTVLPNLFLGCMTQMYVFASLAGNELFLLTAMAYDRYVAICDYIFIVSAILKIQSSEGRQKAFSTCASHLACVITLYGTVICLYMRPTTSYNIKTDRFFSLLYTVLGPVLNPFIYTLKNREFLCSLSKVVKETCMKEFFFCGRESTKAFFLCKKRTGQLVQIEKQKEPSLKRF
eukprot:XP_012822612.1 PREDICTED: olfactory receptor 5M11-like [Xenopus tropicalis]